VNQELDGSDELGGRTGERINGVLVGNIGNEGVRLAAGLPNRTCDGFERFGVASHENDASALPGELASEGGAESATRARDDGGLMTEVHAPGVHPPARFIGIHDKPLE
jgi:hypothetical protein